MVKGDVLNHREIISDLSATIKWSADFLFTVVKQCPKGMPRTWDSLTSCPRRVVDAILRRSSVLAGGRRSNPRDRGDHRTQLSKARYILPGRD